MMITIYTRPDCQPCKATKRKLTRENIPFTEEPLNEEKAAQMSARGFRQAPIVIIADKEGIEMESWSGYRPDRIVDIKESASWKPSKQ